MDCFVASLLAMTGRDGGICREMMGISPLSRAFTHPAFHVLTTDD